MNDQQPDEERIFHVARAIAEDQPRNEYLDHVCYGDQCLRERVQALLETYEKEQNFLASNNAVAMTADHAPIRETEGQQIGRYKLLQKIGEGGFGVVFMAEQQRPVKRRVALKIIKPGMDTREVVARFEAERQALAMMDHTNIARVLDGGATDSGRPFFVMELVKGVPITEYCDKNQLSTEERLKLFANVCQAVQHAHQKGIIHRDLKPSNVLVTLADGQPVVKVIDFGVAKATNQQLTEKTLFTAFGQLVGTPQYMSPEQAEMSCLDVDTRSDVYSLGVLLYELLTGTTPLEAKRLRTAGYAEMQRLIREEEPPKPSTRLSTSGDQLTVLAKHRSVAPDKLKRQVRGDLDWIVMKALEKDRNRRFESPADFLQDVTRYLNNEPVESRPPTFRYRTAKYLWRNRTALSIASLVIALLSVGLAGTISQWINARQALREWGNELIDRGLEDAFRGDVEDVEQIVAKGRKNRVVPEDWCLLLEALAHKFGGSNENGDRILRRAFKSNPDNLAIKAAFLNTRSEGNWSHTEWEKLAVSLYADKPSGDFSKYEQLLLGWGHVYIDTLRAMDLIREVANERPNWPIAQLFLAQAEAHVAIEKDDLELALQAVQRMHKVDRELRGNQFSECIKTWTLVVAMALSREHDPGLFEQLREDCKASMAEFDLDTFAAPIIRGEYHEITNEDLVDAPAFDATDDDWWRACCISYFYRHGKRDRALEELPDEIRTMPLSATVRHSLLAIEGYEDNKQQAMAAYRRIMELHDGTNHIKAHAMYIPLLFGDQETAREDANKLLVKEDLHDIPFFRARTRIEFLAGRYESAEEFLKQVEGSGLGKCYAFFALGVSCIHNNPEQAREYFDECTGTNQVFAMEYYLAKALLKRHPKLQITAQEPVQNEKAGLYP